MKHNKQAKKYSKMFLNMVGIEDAITYIDELTAVTSLMNKSKKLKGLLMGPQFTSGEKEKVLKQLGKIAGFSDYTIKFVTYLSNNMTITSLPEIIRMTTNIYLEKKHKAKAVVITPMKIDRTHESRLSEALKKLTNKDVDMDFVLDPTLIGGILVKVGSTMYDTSIKGQLRLLKDELIKG
ncbi:MAG: ATP synthase F1 subunit delta [Nitrospiraceae bacterium]|nr:ATP synthase F1 subunit delta [Nitrospiraceae bacterium]